MRIALAFASILIGPLSATAAELRGDYLEVRTCDVYTGPCFANAEVGALGKEATLAWQVAEGRFDGVDLRGLAVVAVVEASATLGDPYADPLPARAVLYTDADADAAQRRALSRFARERLGALGTVIAAESPADIRMEVGCCDERGCAVLRVGEAVAVKTRCLCADDVHCGNEEVYYPPLTDGVEAIPAVAVEHRVDTQVLARRFHDRDRRGVFLGAFSMAAEEAPAVAARQAAEEGGYKLISIPAGVEGEEAAPPKEVPEAFSREILPQGLRLLGKDGKPLYDFWPRREVPLAIKPATGMGIKYPDLAIGTFLGVLHAYGKEPDYRDSMIPEGFYAMRYGLQPQDGDHLGTAETRDFVLLTSFEDDKDPAPVGDMVDLQEMSILASSTEHPLVCYLRVPEGEAPAIPRVVRHPEHEEWLADVTLRARKPDAEETTPLRLGVVLVGISPHF